MNDSTNRVEIARDLQAAIAKLPQGPRCTHTPDAVFDRPAAVLGRIAARFCTTCPVRDLCAAVGDVNGEVWGVWGGVDRTRRAGAPR